MEEAEEKETKQVIRLNSVKNAIINGIFSGSSCL